MSNENGELAALQLQFEGDTQERVVPLKFVFRPPKLKKTSKSKKPAKKSHNPKSSRSDKSVPESSPAMDETAKGIHDAEGRKRKEISPVKTGKDEKEKKKSSKDKHKKKKARHDDDAGAKAHKSSAKPADAPSSPL